MNARRWLVVLFIAPLLTGCGRVEVTVLPGLSPTSDLSPFTWPVAPAVSGDRLSLLLSTDDFPEGWAGESGEPQARSRDDICGVMVPPSAPQESSRVVLAGSVVGPQVLEYVDLLEGSQAAAVVGALSDALDSCDSYEALGTAQDGTPEMVTVTIEAITPPTAASEGVWWKQTMGDESATVSYVWMYAADDALVTLVVSGSALPEDTLLEVATFAAATILQR